jgi:hypothetical protein
MSAYFALIMAVVPCCPFVSLAGALLGLIVLGRMQKEAAGLNASGRKVAVAAAIIGLVVSMATTGLFTWWRHRMITSFRQEAASELEKVIRASMTGDAATARQVWRASPDAPSNEEVLAFGRTLQQRYGRFQRFEIDSFVFGGTPLSPTVDLSGVFTFETRELAGSGKLHLWQPAGPFSMDLVLMRVLIEDRTLGDVILAD